MAHRNILPTLATLCLSTAMVIASGCITSPSNPAATQPSTVIDLATTQPSYWLEQPAVAEVRATNFDAAIEASKQVIRDYLFEIDRVDYRSGLVTSRPLSSKQLFEFWRPDTGTLSMQLDNTLNTIRRTIYIDINRAPDSTFILQPKVLVERISLHERRITEVAQYRQIFSGPSGSHANRDRGQISTNEDAESDLTTVPPLYYYPIARDPQMEIDLAKSLRKQLNKLTPAASNNIAANSNPPSTPLSHPRISPAFTPDGKVTAIGPNDTFFIDLVAADKVVPGMTFEVYDPRSPLPTLDQYTRNNPGAKAWVEVVTVGNASSTCKLLSTTPGATKPAQGDPIHNFIFARNTQNHFALTGDFAPATRETLTSLIWRWNGVIDATPTNRTSYLLAGPTPKANAAAQAHTATLDKAKELNIPILSEDQFNQLIRYYDPARK